MKKLLVLVTVFLFVSVIIRIIYFDIIFQEGNPLPIFKAITKLQTGEEIVLISKETNNYITTSKEGYKKIVKYMSEKSWKVNEGEQLGAGHIFEKDGKTMTIVCKQYTNYFKIWTIPNLE